MDRQPTRSVSTRRLAAARPGSRPQRARAKADLAWSALAFLIAQLAFIVLIDVWVPEFYDAEYGARLGLLKERLAEAPESPVLVVVGSSRIGLGFRPEKLPSLTTPSGEVVLPFNFAHLAAGPKVNLLMVERLLREKVRPRWLVVEVVPSFIGHETASMAISCTGAGDLPVLQKFIAPWRVWGVYVRSRLNCWYKHRLGILSRIAPNWITTASRQDVVTLDPLGGDTGWMSQAAVAEEVQRTLTKRTFDGVKQDFAQFRIDPTTDGAMRALLDRCRQEAIDVTLLLLPESRGFRECYPPAVAEQINSYVAGLAEEYQLTVVDARTWMPDELFFDGHHMLSAGADQFTQQFGEQVLRPLVDGTLRRSQRSK